MFSKILIANRGEIACRIISTARRMGIATVAVYSDADAGSKAVHMADEAVWIGAAASADSYLNAEAIITAARQTGAEAIHPGFGFLSENAGFVEAVEAAGLVFIGPGSAAIAAMGDKITSKTLAAKAGVSCVPGTADAVSNQKEAAEAAAEIGYPVMIKASAGGGGKGMRVAEDEAALLSGMAQAQHEAMAAFGDDRVFIEKFVTSPRHIEIQLLADHHGNIIHLGERECSLQRRHQKVLEEAPSPFISASTRAAMGAQAVALAEAVGYRSAGTVEFIVGADQDFYFLEMNTRLQVEHPVTEAVYAIDLVEWMIRIAAGEVLTLDQASVKPRGWAVEARLYAEDPARGFLPSIGMLNRYQEPAGEGVRVDSGILEGGEISMFYDPMIAKLIGIGKTREAALDRLAWALDRYIIEGPGNNRAFLRAVCDHPKFRAGDMTTGFIAEEYPDGYIPSAPPAALRPGLLALAAAVVAERQGRLARLGSTTDNATTVMDLLLYPDDSPDDGEKPALPVEARVSLQGMAAMVELDGMTVQLESLPPAGARLAEVGIDGSSRAIQLQRQAETVQLSEAGHGLAVLVLPRRAGPLQALMPAAVEIGGAGEVKAPMPGLLRRLLVTEGQRVEAGAEVAVIEAMKMENLLRAEHGGVVTAILAGEGENLRVDQPILRFGEAVADKDAGQG